MNMLDSEGPYWRRRDSATGSSLPTSCKFQPCPCPLTWDGGRGPEESHRDKKSFTSPGHEAQQGCGMACLFTNQRHSAGPEATTSIVCRESIDIQDLIQCSDCKTTCELGGLR